MKREEIMHLSMQWKPPLVLHSEHLTYASVEIIENRHLRNMFENVFGFCSGAVVMNNCKVDHTVICSGQFHLYFCSREYLQLL